MKSAFVFSGQGAQYVGMGKELVENFSEAEAVFVEAQGVLDFDLKELCFFGPQEELTRTEVTQPAMLAVSMAAFEVLRFKGFEPDYVAGHSLGEYTALAAAEVFSTKDALKLVSQRGKWMAEAVPQGQGAMAAVLGMTPQEVQLVCEAASQAGTVVPANYNSPGQIVISGSAKAVEEAGKIALERGAKRVLPLAVSGPFHSPLMSQVSDKLSQLLNTVAMEAPKYGFVANVSARSFSEPPEIRQGLAEQVRAPVLWQQSIEYLISKGVSVFVEVGPGKVLRGLIKKIDSKVTILNVEDLKSLEDTYRILGEVK